MAQTSFRALAALSLSLLLGLARAQDPDSYDDPPDRAARLSYLSGDVSMQPAGEDAWAPAIVNRPLTTGDKLWTERGARAEIDVGPAAVRLDGGTGFSFLNVDDDTIQMRMTAGVLYVNVRELDGNDHVEVDTPNVAVSVLRPGSYRVEVNDAGDTTTVKISEGEAEVDGPGQNVVVHAQQAVTFRGEDDLVADWGSLRSPDDFDRWNLERERRDERLASSRTSEYVSPDVTGYEDLDEYGTWSSEPEYGYVWTPTRVVFDWAPYRYGRWVWISPWGWTWIDDAPWGYAPSHFGRWAHLRNRWCWVPGPRHVRAVYAPALVGWVGSPGVSISVSVGGGVGWFPLGPREVYVPGRHFSRRYLERVNVSNTVIVNRTYINEVYVNGGRHVDYRNRHVPGAFTAVSRDTFVNAGRTGDRGVRMDERQFARANVSTTPQFQPGRESRLGAAPRSNVRVPPPTVVNRQVVVRRDPPAANAHFARARGNEDLARAPTERFQQRPQDRPQDRSSIGNPRSDGDRVLDRNPPVVDRNRTDRPVRVSPQPTNPPVNVPEPRDVQERQRDDRPPKQRDPRGDDRSFERERQARQQEQQAEARDRWQRPDDSQRWQRNDDQQRQQRDQQQREMQQRDQQMRQQQERQQEQSRERYLRQQESDRQRNEQRQQQQERQQEARQQQERHREEPRQSRPAPQPQDDKPRQRPKDQDDARPNRE